MAGDLTRRARLGRAQLGLLAPAALLGHLLAGRATRELDLGLGRDLFSREVYGRGTDYDTWGAGRVDVTSIVTATSVGWCA